MSKREMAFWQAYANLEREYRSRREPSAGEKQPSLEAFRAGFYAGITYEFSRLDNVRIFSTTVEDDPGNNLENDDG